MRYHSLFYASLLHTAVLAQTGVHEGSESAQPTALTSKNSSGRWNATHHIPHNVTTNSSSNATHHHPTPSGYATGLPAPGPANVTGLYASPFNGSKTAVFSKESHLPYTKSSGPLFINTTLSLPHPTGTGHASISGTNPLPFSHPTHSSAIESSSKAEGVAPASGSHLPYTKGGFFVNSTSGPISTGGFVHPSGTAPSSGFAHPTGVSNHTKPSETPTSISSGTGRLPFSQGNGAHFVNATASAGGPANTGVLSHASGTGASSGFALPSESQKSSKPVLSGSASILPTGRLPFSRGGAHFANSTSSGVAQSTGTGFFPHGSGTGASSGFAKPTGHHNFTFPASIHSSPSSGTGRLPFTKGAGFFSSSTSGAAQPTGSGYAHPSGGSSGFAKPTGHHNFTAPAPITKQASSTGRLPLKSTSSIYYANSTTINTPAPTLISSAEVLSTALLTGSFSSGNVASTGRLPFTTSSGLVFTNSTSSSVSQPTGFPASSVIPSDPLPTHVLSTEGYATGSARLPYTKSSALFTNSTTGTKILSTASGIFPSGALPTGIFSSAYATGSGSPPIKTSISALNATSSAAPLSSSTALPFSSSNSTSSYPSASATTMITKASSPSVGTSTLSSATGSVSAVVIAEYYQCGGLNWTGSGSCSKGNVCKYWNPYYSQCVDERYA